MWVIVCREGPGRPWEFVTNHAGTRQQAQKSAEMIEKQERTTCGHPKTQVKLLAEAQWEGGVAGASRKRRKPAQKSPEDKLSILDLLNSPGVEDKGM